MELQTQIRQRLYNKLPFVSVVHDPDDSITFSSDKLNIVDLTYDVTAHHRMYHENQQAVIESLRKADLIVCDSSGLEVFLKSLLVGKFAPIMTASFGLSPAKDAEVEGGLRIGLLSATVDQAINLMASRPLLNELDEEFLIYGEEIEGVSGLYLDDFAQFAAACDILLLPAAKGSVNSPTLPYSVMAAGTAVVYQEARGFESLAAAGTRMVSNRNVDAWRLSIEALRGNLRRLDQLKQFNINHVNKLSTEAMNRVKTVATGLEDIRRKKMRLAVQGIEEDEEPHG